MICRNCGTDTCTELRDLLCRDCWFNHNHEVEERALRALERIAEALEGLTGSVSPAWYPVRERKP
jgi:hypothetical protein